MKTGPMESSVQDSKNYTHPSIWAVLTATHTLDLGTDSLSCSGLACKKLLVNYWWETWANKSRQLYTYQVHSCLYTSYASSCKPLS